jgi:hypothetical protein
VLIAKIQKKTPKINCSKETISIKLSAECKITGIFSTSPSLFKCKIILSLFRLNVNFKNRSPIIECAFRKGKAPLSLF